MLRVVHEDIGDVNVRIARPIEEVKLNRNNIACLESIIDDFDNNIHDTISLMDEVRKDLDQLVKMNQCSHYQMSPSNEANPVDEIPVIQLVHGKYRKG